MAVYAAAVDLVERFWRPRLQMPGGSARDPKDRAAGMGAGARPAAAHLPTVDRPSDHNPQFRIAVELPGFTAVEAAGSSKQIAQKAAAFAFLEQVDS